MRKVAILTCLRSNDVCARVGCLKAFRNMTAFFQEYPQDTELSAMMTCNGCRSMKEEDPKDDKGMQEKVERLVKEGVTDVHVGVCRLSSKGTECRRITQICEMIEEQGIHVVRGTHQEK